MLCPLQKLHQLNLCWQDLFTVTTSSYFMYCDGKISISNQDVWCTSCKLFVCLFVNMYHSLYICVYVKVLFMYVLVLCVWQNFNFPPRRMVRTYRLPRLHTLLHCSQLFIQTTNHHDPQTYWLLFTKANDLRDLTINPQYPGCILSLLFLTFHTSNPTSHLKTKIGINFKC